jgi:hypothetical protein
MKGPSRDQASGYTLLAICFLLFSNCAGCAVVTLYSTSGVGEAALLGSMQTIKGCEGLLLYERYLVHKGVDGKPLFFFGTVPRLV